MPEQTAHAKGTLTVTVQATRHEDIWECDSCPDPGGKPHGYRGGDEPCPGCGRQLRLHPAGTYEQQTVAVLYADGSWRNGHGRNWTVREE